MKNLYKKTEDGLAYRIFFKDGSFFLIDKDDFPLVSQRTWFKGKRGYPVSHPPRKEGHKTETLHRFLLGADYNGDIDHITGNKMDNRRENLRNCTHQQNMFNQKIRSSNSSGYQGVSYSKNAGKYEAYINHSGRKKHLGLFNTAFEAAVARDKAAKELFGEYAKLNISGEGAW